MDLIQIDQATSTDTEPSVGSLADHFRKLQIVVSDKLKLPEGGGEECVDGGFPTKDYVNSAGFVGNKSVQAVELETSKTIAVQPVDNDQTSYYPWTTPASPSSKCLRVNLLIKFD